MYACTGINHLSPTATHLCPDAGYVHSSILLVPIPTPLNMLDTTNLEEENRVKHAVTGLNGSERANNKSSFCYLSLLQALRSVSRKAPNMPCLDERNRWRYTVLPTPICVNSILRYINEPLVLHQGCDLLCKANQGLPSAMHCTLNIAVARANTVLWSPSGKLHDMGDDSYFTCISGAFIA